MGEPGAEIPADASPTPSGNAQGATPVADLGIQVPEPIQIIPGGTSVYTLTVRNDGPDPAKAITLTDSFPEGLVPVWTQPYYPLCTRQGRTVECDVGDLQGGDAATVSLDLSVAGTETPITGTHLAGVTIDLSTPTCTIDQDPASPGVTCYLPDLEPGAYAQIRVAVGVDARRAALTPDSLVHTVVVTSSTADANPANNGAAFATAVDSSGTLPNTTIPALTDLLVQAEGPSDVTAGRPFTYTFTISNQGSLAATGVRFEDEVPSDMNLLAYAPGQPVCEQRGEALTCILHDLDSSEPITVTLAVTGAGDQPIKLSLDPLMPGWPICIIIKENTWQHVVQCELGRLEPGQSIDVQMVLTAIGVRERVTANTAAVVANEPETNLLDNTITTTIAVQIEADLQLRPAFFESSAAGQALTYTLMVVNAGPSDADNVVLVDTLPPGTRLLSAIPSQGDGCQTEADGTPAGTVTCSLDRLESTQAATVTLAVEVDDLSQVLTHTATVSAEPADPDPGNNVLAESLSAGRGDGE